MSQQNKFVSGLAALCAVVWVLAAIHAVDRQAWILENLLVVLFVATLAFAHRRLHLSYASYIFIAFRHSSHDWGTLYVCKNAHWSLGEGFLRILAKPRRPSRSFWVRIFSGIPSSGTVASLRRNPSRLEFLAAARDHSRDQRFF